MRLRVGALALSGAAVTAALAGCTAAGSQTVSASGKTLTVYLSAPAASAGDPVASDVLDAERLAFSQLASSVTSYKLNLRVLAATPSDNARKAIEDSSAIAYLGELAPGASADSIGITNFDDLLQVSPTDTALELTQASAAVSGSPDRYYEDLKDYKRTFARVVPSTGREAAAIVREMGAMRVHSVYLVSDGSEYGRALSLAFKQVAGSTVTVQASAMGADAAFYAGSSAAGAAALFGRLAQSEPKLKLFVPSALGTQAFTGALSPAAARAVVLSSPGFLDAKLSRTARSSFAAPFAAAYHHAPAPAAIFGYEAMAAVLAVLHEDGSLANDRGKVVADFLAISNRASVLGSYSINSNGDTSIAPFVFERLQSGRQVPFASQTAG